MTNVNRIFGSKRIKYPYLVQYVHKEDGRLGQGYRCATLEEAEAEKAAMEKVWGAELWDVVITKE